MLIDIGSLDYQGMLGPPILEGGRQCGPSSPVYLSLSGGTRGNLYEVYEYDFAAQKEGAFVGSFPVAPNDDGLTLGSVAFSAPDASYVARQRDLSGQFSSWSQPYSLPWPVPLVSTDMTPWPIWECGTAVGATGHQPGDELRLMTGGVSPSVRFVVPQAYGTHEYLPAGGNGPFSYREVLSAEYFKCGASVGGTSRMAQRFSGTLPIPVLPPSAFIIGNDSFLVSSVVNGATLDLSISGAGGAVQWTEHCAWSPCRVRSPAGDLMEGDKVVVTQRLCSNSTSGPATIVVPDCGSTVPPTLDSAPKQGDTILTLRTFSPGTTVVVLISRNADPRLDQQIVGVAPAAVLIPLMRALDATDRWVIVTQASSSCPPSQANAFQVLD